MKWQDFGRSANVEDRRGQGPACGRGGLGIGTVIVLGLLGWALGIDPRLLIGGAEMVNKMRPGSQTDGDAAGADRHAVRRHGPIRRRCSRRE